MHSPCTLLLMFASSPCTYRYTCGDGIFLPLWQDSLVNATRAPITLSGLKVYSAFFEPGMGYRIDNTTGLAKGNEEETLYMVTSGKHYNDGCCFE